MEIYRKKEEFERKTADLFRNLSDLYLKVKDENVSQGIKDYICKSYHEKNYILTDLCEILKKVDIVECDSYKYLKIKCGLV